MAGWWDAREVIVANKAIKVYTHDKENLYGGILITEENLVEIGLIIVEILTFLNLPLLLFQG